MSRQKTIQIQIPNPCSQNWEEMTPAGKGRFCNHCKQTVIDFTEWSDAALYSYLAKNEGNECGRYNVWQLNRPLYIPYQPHSRLYRIAVGMGLVLLFSQMPAANAKRPPYVIENVCSITGYGDDYEPQPGHAKIYGKVYNEKIEPVIDAKVELIKSGLAIAETITDSEGTYTFHDQLAAGNYDIRVTASGFVQLTTTSVPVDAESTRYRNFYLVKRTNASQQPITEPYFKPQEKFMGMKVRIK